MTASTPTTTENSPSLGRVDLAFVTTPEGQVAVLTISNPPVNAGSHAVRSGIVDGLARAIDANVCGAVLIGAGRCFVAGSDLREFGKPLAYPELPDVIAKLEAAPFPVVAALHGVALGGGLELSLGCDYRIAAPETKLGLPEVSLGFIPGAGGTQRLPRLIGASASIDLICRAARVPATQALKLGFVDAVVGGDLQDAAIGFLTETPRPKRLAMTQFAPEEPAEAIEAAEAKAVKRGKGRPNITTAIDLVKTAAAGVDALTQERAEFQKLRLSEDAFALRYLFFAERRAANVDGLDMKLAQPLKTVGVLGGGTMGQGIARSFLAAGIPVTLIERDSDALEKALSALNAHYEAQTAKGRLTPDQAQSRAALLTGTVGLEALADADLVIEAVFEDMDVKKQVLSTLEGVVSNNAILATNTSYLDIDEMVAGLSHPERVLGLHFFSPADVMPLLEVVRAKSTSDPVLATGLKLARKLGKQPAVSRVAEGFIGNRIYAAYRRRAELLVLDGATPQQVDEAATAFGFAMGPFAVSDMSGLDIAWAMRKRQAATRDPDARYVTIPDSLCEAGRLGRKTGQGWYDYSSGKAQPDPKVDEIIDAARVTAGIAPRDYDARTIQHQLLAAIVNEAACLLDEGVAQRPSDVDVVIANGYGFPRWRGGPLYWAKMQPVDVLAADLEELAKAIGHGHTAGPVALILSQIETGQES